MNRARLLVSSLAVAVLASCGRQGDLYLPEAARDIVTRPLQAPEPGTPETSNSPQTVDSPETPASPAPESPEETEKKNAAPPPKN